MRSRTPAVYYADIVAERAKIQYSSLNNAPGLIKVHQNLTYTMVRGGIRGIDALADYI